MRLDKFLQLSRLIPSRNDAKRACDMGYILVNRKRAKASKTVSPGDEILMNLPRGQLRVRVLEIPKTKTVSRQDAQTLYQVLE